jgi:hypothetical protein
MDHRQRHARKRGSAEIHPGELMTPWVYDEKFLMSMQLVIEMISFKAGEDDDLEQLQLQRIGEVVSIEVLFSSSFPSYI